MPRARAFYEAVLQTTLQPLAGGGEGSGGLELWAFPWDMNTPGAAGALAHMAGFRPGGGGTIVYFKCDDCAAEAARVEPAGGRIHKPKISIGQYGFIALALDPDGNMFGLHSMK